MITGLNNKIGPLRSPNVISILKSATPAELARGVREINLASLRIPRTAIYIVTSEDNASNYRLVIELIFGLAAIEMRESTGKNATPVLMALDEAGNVHPPKLPEKLKIGRFRNTPYLLGFQDVAQIRTNFKDAWSAVLAGIKTQIFLPGVDHETGVHASALLGPTTVLSRTEIDAEGRENDAERVSESRRDFRQPPELRRLVKYRQGIAIIDTADPILFRFLPRADNGDVAVPPRRVLDSPQTLAEAVQAMNEIKEVQKKSAATPMQSNGNSKDKTAIDGLRATDPAQSDETNNKLRGDSFITRELQRAGDFERPLLAFDTLSDEE
jgi:type IV secretory pathway TraG/TraD family ATPase VirD4